MEGVGGSAKYLKVTKSEKGIILLDQKLWISNLPTVILKMVLTDPQYQEKFKIRRKRHDLMNILRAGKSYLVTFSDFEHK